jgi:hypothetical protein
MIAVDPTYAPAYTGLADAYRSLEGEPKESLPKRKAAVRRALELDENLDESEQAFALLERAYAGHSPSLQFLKVDPAFDGLRSDPRFRRRVGLSQ